MLQPEAVLLLQADSFFFLFKQILVTQLSPGLLSSPKLKHLEYYGLKTLSLLLKKNQIFEIWPNLSSQCVTHILEQLSGRSLPVSHAS